MGQRRLWRLSGECHLEAAEAGPGLWKQRCFRKSVDFPDEYAMGFPRYPGRRDVGYGEAESGNDALTR